VNTILPVECVEAPSVQAIKVHPLALVKLYVPINCVAEKLLGLSHLLNLGHLLK
jgi:hypothetical protein